MFLHFCTRTTKSSICSFTQLSYITGSFVTIQFFCGQVTPTENKREHLNTRAMVTRVGQNHIYMVYIQHFWQGHHQIYSHIRRIYTVLANPHGDTLIQETELTFGKKGRTTP
jgi:hypothetical protein